MNGPSTKLAPRRFGRAEAKRLMVTLPLFGVVFGAWWLVLPLLQWMVVPGDGGGHGPWVVRPIMAFHFGACAVLTAVAMPVVMRPLLRWWRAQDAAQGSRYDPFAGRPVKKAATYLKALVLLVIYGAALVFYVRSWTEIGARGIAEQLPWGRRIHAYGDVVALEQIPAGMRVESLARNGPSYTIRFGDGRSANLSLDHEGCSEAELKEIAAFVGRQTARKWEVNAEARRR